jgi:hypothetical protein
MGKMTGVRAEIMYAIAETGMVGIGLLKPFTVSTDIG